MSSPLLFHQTIVPDSCTGRGSLWRCACSIDGLDYHIDSRSGAAHALARVLVVAGIPDQPVRVTSDTGTAPGTIDYRSLHWLAEHTISEGERPVQIRPYVALPNAPYTRKSLSQAMTAPSTVSPITDASGERPQAKEAT